MSLLVRVDCNRASGFGHFTRCLSLARHVRAARPDEDVLVLGSLDEFARALLDAYQVPWRICPPFGAAEPVAPAGSPWDVVVTDSYMAARKDLEAVRTSGSTGVYVSDFNPQVAAGADVVVDFTVGADTLPYAARRTFLGPKAFLDKPEFAGIRERNLGSPRREVKEILLLLGTAPAPAHLEPLLRALDGALASARVRLVAPKGTVPPTVGMRRNRFEVVAPTPFVERLYADADLVVCGGGLTKYESAYCAIPQLSLSRTRMQLQDSQRLEASGLTKELTTAGGGAASRLAAEVRAFVEDAGVRQAQVERSAEVFATGSGARVARELMGHVG